MRRVLLDQGLPRSTARILRGHGWDAVHVGDVGLARAPDAHILSVAAEGERVVVTLDADFHAILATSGRKGPSVIRIRREGMSGANLAELLLRCWPKIEKALQAGAMVSVTDTSIRIHRLPAGS